jgi:hypothetical protein
VESDLRRSKRLREARAGFRQGSCQKKNCLMCQHKFEDPPSLSAKVIRNLGAKFCSMSEDDLSNKMLKKNKNSSGCVGPKKLGKKDKNDKEKVKGKCALGPFLSILVIECQYKCLNVNLYPWMNKVQIKSKGMFLSLSTLVLCTNILV